MIRIKLILVVFGCLIAFFGWKEVVLSRHAKPQAEEVSVAALEEGKIPENGHVVIKNALAVYPLAVYHYTKSKYSNSAPTDNTNINDAIYPVVSMSHPLAKALATEHPDKNAVHQALSSVAVVVKTRRFTTVGSIPNQVEDVGNLEGLVLNAVESLPQKDVDLLRKSIPQIDASKVVIIEQGRQPKPLVAGLGMVAGGALAAILGGAWALIRR